jgi:hypothetical protein
VEAEIISVQVKKIECSDKKNYLLLHKFYLLINEEGARRPADTQLDTVSAGGAAVSPNFFEN